MYRAKQTDSELLAEFAATHADEPFAELVRRHGPMVQRVCRRVLGPRADCDDAMQAIFLTLARKAHAIQGRDSIAGWLHWVAWHISRRVYRASVIRRFHEQKAAEAPEKWWACCNTGDEEILFDLHRALDALPERYREALVLHHLEGRTVEESARLLSCKVGTVAARISRGREMLRQEMQWRGWTLSGAAVSVLLNAAGPEESVSSARAEVPAAAMVQAAQGTAALSAGIVPMRGFLPPSIPPLGYTLPGLAASRAAGGLIALLGTTRGLAALIAAAVIAFPVAGAILVQVIETESTTSSNTVSLLDSLIPSNDNADSGSGWGSSATPEPGTLSLLAAGSLLLLQRRRRPSSTLDKAPAGLCQ